jgi:hypothetical protein
MSSLLGTQKRVTDAPSIRNDMRDTEGFCVGIIPAQCSVRNASSSTRRQTTECLRCGIIFRKFTPEGEAAVPPPLTADEEATLEGRQEDRQELIFRVFAVPVALLLARGTSCSCRRPDALDVDS